MILCERRFIIRNHKFLSSISVLFLISHYRRQSSQWLWPVAMNDSIVYRVKHIMFQFQKIRYSVKRLRSHLIVVHFDGETEKFHFDIRLYNCAPNIHQLLQP